MDRRKHMVLKGIFISSFFIFGLFMEYAACLYTAIYGIYFSVIVYPQKKCRLFLNIEGITLCSIICFSFLSILWGVDSGMSFIGFVKFLGILFFMGILMQLSDEERWDIVSTIPVTGTVMTVIGIISLPIQPLYQHFYVAERLGGFFQYPNVFGLFCLLGILCTISNIYTGIFPFQGKKTPVSSVLVITVLAAGILLSGSRTIFALLLLSLFVLALSVKEIRKPALLAVFLLVVISGCAFFMGNFQNLGRFFTTSLSQSTFLGRILYLQDSLQLLTAHPLGLGYLGYYYKEPSIQTGLYSVRFVHNDFVQMALDFGWIPGILFILLFIKNIVNKNHGFIKRLIFSIFALHILLDFDMEFMSMWYLLLLLTDCSSGKEIVIKHRRCIPAIIPLCIIALYLTVGMLPRYLGKPDISSKLLPFYTESNVALLRSETHMTTAQDLALAILEQNKYIPEAYDILGIVEYANGDYEKMHFYKKQSLSLQKYNIEAYEKYVTLLAQAIHLEQETNNSQNIMHLLNCVKEIPEIIDSVKNDTSDIAYRIHDVPQFELSEEYQEYINQIKELTE